MLTKLKATLLLVVVCIVGGCSQLGNNTGYQEPGNQRQEENKINKDKQASSSDNSQKELNHEEIATSVMDELF